MPFFATRRLARCGRANLGLAPNPPAVQCRSFRPRATVVRQCESAGGRLQCVTRRVHGCSATPASPANALKQTVSGWCWASQAAVLDAPRGAELLAAFSWNHFAIKRGALPSYEQEHICVGSIRIVSGLEMGRDTARSSPLEMSERAPIRRCEASSGVACPRRNQ